MKIKDTPAQTSLTKHERLNNLTGAYECTSEAAVSIAGKDLVLLDDVITTGATLREAKAALLPHKPKSIICVALAH